MRLVLITIIIAIITYLFGNILNQSNEIKHLKHELEYKQFQVDSLQNVNDSIIKRYQWFDIKPINSMIDLMNAIMEVESNHNDSAHAKNEDAVGCLQIRKCLVNDVNRILKDQNSHIRFTYNDRWSRYKSIQMFRIYCKHYNLNTEEEIARCWNGGPRGMSKPLTVNYWRKVKKNLDS